MIHPYRHFIFEDFTLRAKDKMLTLRYSLDGKITFEERFVFDFPWHNADTPALTAACKGLWIMAGISYFKAFLPPEITFRTGGIDEAQAAFFQTVYTRGLGEFFYRNDIDPRDKVNFIAGAPSIPPPATDPLDLRGSLVPIGGGKDSLVTAQLLKTAGETFDLWAVNAPKAFDVFSQKLGMPRIDVERTISSQLIQCNHEGALNGHVPISAIWAFASVVSALLAGKKTILFSNESSANDPNTVFHGMAINHQYSKSLDFERAFRNYVYSFITPEVEYCSFLRPLSEIKIAELFAHHCWKDFSEVFSSCNRNFHLNTNDTQLRWCGQCPKCAFVYLILSAFVEETDLLSIFGKDLSADPKLRETFEALLGLRDVKPFECVGSAEEARWAWHTARARGHLAGLGDLNVPKTDFSPETQYPHCLPGGLYTLLSRFL